MDTKDIECPLEVLVLDNGKLVPATDNYRYQAGRVLHIQHIGFGKVVTSEEHNFESDRGVKCDLRWNNTRVICSHIYP